MLQLEVLTSNLTAAELALGDADPELELPVAVAGLLPLIVFAPVPEAPVEAVEEADEEATPKSWADE